MTKIINEAFFMELAALAAQASLPFFRQPIVVDNKDVSGFDPVTMADRKTEEMLRQFIHAHRPHDGIYGEEKGMENENAEYVWVIDPIDGTRAFISGLPVWGVLIGLLQNGRAIAGMMAQPFTQELFFATEKGGSFLQHGKNSSLQPIHVRSTQNLDHATLFSTDPTLFKGEKRQSFAALYEKVQLTRYGTDCYAFAMLASGFVDLVVETGLKPYDIVALIPIIENAGGIITNWDGGRAESGGDIVAAATPELHAAALAVLQSQ